MELSETQYPEIELLSSKDEDQFAEARSCCSKLCFLWVFKYIRLGFSNKLSGLEDMPKLQRKFCAATLSSRAILFYDQQSNHSIWRTAWKMHRKPLCIGLMLGVTQGISNNALIPILLKYTIIALNPNSEWTSSQVYQLFTVFAAVAFLQGWARVNSQQIIHAEVGNQFASWLLALLQRKTTKLRGCVNVLDTNQDCKNNEKSNVGKDTSNIDSSKSELGVQEGKHVANDITLIGNDVVMHLEKMWLTSQFPQLLTGLITGIFAIIWLLGAPGVLGLFTMFFIFFICKQFTKKAGKVFKRDMEAADVRLAMMRALITNILPLKYLCWEESYFDQILEKRKLELKEVLTYRQTMVSAISLGRAAPVLSSLVTFIFIGVHDSYELTASAVFSSLAAFNALRLSSILLPVTVQFIKDMIVSARRIEEFLAHPEHVDLPNPKSLEVAVSIRAADLSWQSKLSDEDMNDRFISAEYFCLRNVNMDVKWGELIAIVGRVGTGKSMLLSSMIGDTIILKGTVEIAKSKIGYVSQKPFILSGTLLENILMGRKRDDRELHRVIENSSLREDISLMPKKLYTEIGEEGVTLSGGQQMRLSIARAIYGDPDLLLIDDCLAAVDGAVARVIFNKVFKGRNKRAKTTIAVLNQVYLLKNDCWSRIVFLNENKGREVMMGTFDDLIKKSSSFSELISSVTMSEMNIFDNIGQTIVSAKTKDVNDIDVSIRTKVPLSPRASQAGGDNLFRNDVIETGSIDFHNLYPYFESMGGPWYILVTCLIGLIAYGLLGINDLWLAAWVTNTGSMSTANRCIGYTAFSFGHALFVMTLSFWNAKRCNKANGDIHRNCVSRILHAPSSWHDETPSGRILSRFGGDLSQVDHIFSTSLDDMTQFTFLHINLFVIIMILIPEMAIIVIPSILLFSISVVAVIRSDREAKRQVNLSLAPLLTNVVETAYARQLTNAMGFGSFFCLRHERNIQRFVRANHLSGSTMNWGFLISNYIGFVFTVSALFFVYIRNYKDVAKIGITLNYCAVVPYFMSMNAVIIMTFGNGLISLERVLQYAGDWLPQEPSWKLPSDPLPCNWLYPKSAALSVPTLSFQDVSLSYRQGLPLVVKNVTFEIKQGEHVGLVGKTGAGKSSLIALIFRIVELNTGKIFLLGKDTATLGVHTVRDAVGIITQQPLLLPGTLANNLDPFVNFSRGQLIETVEKVGLSSSYLDKSVTALSGGQKQLMALARLLLACDAAGCSPPLIVLDEPTANIDVQTDQQIQKIVSEQFNKVSTLTIAHRLETIIASDRILVMDQGKLVEYDTAKNLLADGGSMLSAMVTAAGEEAAIDLRRRALLI